MMQSRDLGSASQHLFRPPAAFGFSRPCLAACSQPAPAHAVPTRMRPPPCTTGTAEFLHAPHFYRLVPCPLFYRPSSVPPTFPVCLSCIPSLRAFLKWSLSVPFVSSPTHFFSHLVSALSSRTQTRFCGHATPAPHFFTPRARCPLLLHPQPCVSPDTFFVPLSPHAYPCDVGPLRLSNVHSFALCPWLSHADSSASSRWPVCFIFLHLSCMYHSCRRSSGGEAET